jgi:hypothetical protein
VLKINFTEGFFKVPFRGFRGEKREAATRNPVEALRYE